MRTDQERNTVIALKAAGQSIRQIARIMKMSRKTIRRILAGKAAAKLDRPSRYEPLSPLVVELFGRFDGNATLVRQGLLEQYGYDVPYTSLTRLVRELGLRGGKSKRSGSFRYPPGHESQHDTSRHPVVVAGKTVKAQCAAWVLANSRLLFMQYYPRFTRFEAKIFVHQALDYIQGATDTCVIDNTSVLVAAGSGADAVIAPEMEAFAAVYGMDFVAHEIGHANRSALVERNFHFIENNFLPGRQFTDWQHLNAEARNWCDNVANNKIKRALGMTARQAYQSERAFLKPLPAVTPPIYQPLTRTVDLYGFVAVDTNRYSVPERLCAKRVEIHKGLYEIRIFHNHKLVATHERLLDRRDGKITAPGHHQPPRRKAGKSPSSPLLRQLAEHSQDLKEYVGKIAAGRRSTITRKLKRLLAIKRDYPKTAFDKAIARALHYGVYDLNRLEKIILTFIAGDFFDLDEQDHDENH